MPATSIAISPSSLTMTLGDTATLDATVYPTNATKKDVLWSSTNPSVAYVETGTDSNIGDSCSVIANKYKVSGNDTTFYASGKIPGWVAYKNGVIVRRENAIPIVLTMADAYQIYTELTNTD